MCQNIPELTNEKYFDNMGHVICISQEPVLNQGTDTDLFLDLVSDSFCVIAVMCGTSSNSVHDTDVWERITKTNQNVPEVVLLRGGVSQMCWEGPRRSSIWELVSVMALVLLAVALILSVLFSLRPMVLVVLLESTTVALFSVPVQMLYQIRQHSSSGSAAGTQGRSGASQTQRRWWDSEHYLHSCQKS